MRHLTQKDLIFIQEWVVTPEDEREFKSQAALSRHLGFTEKTISTAIAKLKVPVGGSDFETFMSHLKREVLRPNCPPKRQELYAQLMGWKIDRVDQRIKFELGADEYFRIREEARRRISEISRETNRDRDLFGLPLVPEKTREDTG